MRLYRVHRPDGVKSKPSTREKLLAMYAAGNLEDSWIVTDEEGRFDRTVKQFIAEGSTTTRGTGSSTGKSAPRSGTKKKKASQREQIPNNLPSVCNSTAQRQPPYDCTAAVLAPEDPITASDFLEFAGRLPEREVVLELEGSAAQRKLKLSEVLKLANDNPTTIWIFYVADMQRFVLRRAEKKNGWLCVKFGNFYDALVTELIRKPQLALDASTVQSLYECSNRFAARLQAGLTLADVREALTSVLTMEGHTDLLTRDVALTRALLSGPVESLQKLMQTWTSLAPVSCPRISPIGLPTISSTFKGLVVSSLFNSAFSFVDALIEDSQSRALNREIQTATRIVLLARAVCVERLRR
jgi:hypothetical protein